MKRQWFRDLKTCRRGVILLLPHYVILPDSVSVIGGDAFAGGKIRALFGNTAVVREYAKNKGLNVIETGLFRSAPSPYSRPQYL